MAFTTSSWVMCGATTASLALPTLAAATATVDQAVSAPATAHVQFERSAVTPAVRRTAATGTTPAVPATVAQASRSLVRAAYTEQLAVAQRAQARERASRVSRSDTRVSPVPVDGDRGAAAVAIASRYFGVPYRYGGTSPRGFDCSGLTQYVYAQLGVNLPRTAAQQYGAVRRVPRSQAQPGDLVFFFGGGSISHVAIYAGGNMMIAAPRSGTVVRKQEIYTANVAFGRP